MKNILFLMIIIFIVNTVKGQDDNYAAEQIWNNYFEAIGSQEDLEKIQTVIKTTLLITDNGLVSNITKISIPDKLHSKINMGDNIIETTVLNNGKAIRKTEKGVEELSGYELTSSTLDARFINKNALFDTGYQLSRLENETYNDIEYYRIQWYNDEFKETLIYYIDKETYLIPKLVRKIEDKEFTMIINKTIVVDGILLFKEGDIIVNGSTIEMRMTYRFNTELDKSLFKLKKYY